MVVQEDSNKEYNTLNEEELAAYIKELQEAYYNGSPLVSDATFDVLWDRLKELNPENPLLSSIGADKNTLYAKRTHIMFMHSQDKVQGAAEFLSWAKKHPYDEYLIEDKLDGMSLELQYQNGRLMYAVSRGDGYVGDDISHNVFQGKKQLLRGAVITLSDNFSGAVRGEVIMRRSVHQEYYLGFANCRNTVNGIMKRKDNLGVENAELICYDVRRRSDNPDEQFAEETEKLDWLQQQGFQIVRHKIVSNADAVVSYHQQVQQERSTLDFDIDGLVIKPLKCDYSDMQRRRPVRQIAFKFQSDEAETTLIDVIWQGSGHVYTPVALVEPVQIAGTTVKRASVVNLEIIEELGLKKGARVRISKRGDIIPKIEALVSISGEAAEEISPPPPTCPVCGTAIRIEPTRVSCPNPDCPTRQRHRIDKWLLVTGVRGLGKGIIDKLVEGGRVGCIYDLYTLTVEELAAVERIGTVLAEKLIASLNENKELSLSQFIAGFDIQGIGELTIAALTEAGYTTLEVLRKASTDELAQVFGIGEITAKQLVAGLASAAKEMDQLIAHAGIRIRQFSSEGALVGKSVCFTGTLDTMDRKEATRLAESKGAKVLNQVSKSLDYLVTNDKSFTSSKAVKARALGIQVISEEEFLALE